MVAVTVIVLVIGLLVALVAVNEGTFPVPDAPNPIAVFEFVHPKVAPVVGLVKLLAETVAPAQTVIFETAFTVGDGLTVIVNVSGVPEQPLALGVTVIVLVIGLLVVFVAVKDGMFPVPDAASPTDVLEFVQV